MILMLPLIYFEKNQIAPPYHIPPCLYFIYIFQEMFNILMSVSNYSLNLGIRECHRGTPVPWNLVRRIQTLFSGRDEQRPCVQ